MSLTGCKLLEMAVNGWEWLHDADNGSKGWKWQKLPGIVGNGLKLLEMV